MMAVVAVVVAVLLPVVRTARESAQRTVSMSNLRQIYAGLALYSPDFDAGVYGTAPNMGLPPTLQALGQTENLPPSMFRSGCPSLRAPTMREALFRQMWHFDNDPTQENWLTYADRYQGDSVLVGDINCDFRDHFYANPFFAHRGIALYQDGHVATIIRMGSTFPYEWWSLTLAQ